MFGSLPLLFFLKNIKNSFEHVDFNAKISLLLDILNGNSITQLTLVSTSLKRVDYYAVIMKLPPLKVILINIIYWTCVAIVTVISTAIGKIKLLTILDSGILPVFVHEQVFERSKELLW